ncbi:MAG: hypothetical protein IKA57_01235 [Clostridia bacterium]|nr:hypothetical protein [Clostridia bacterium]
MQSKEKKENTLYKVKRNACAPSLRLELLATTPFYPYETGARYYGEVVASHSEVTPLA